MQISQSVGNPTGLSTSRLDQSSDQRRCGVEQTRQTHAHELMTQSTFRLSSLHWSICRGAADGRGMAKQWQPQPLGLLLASHPPGRLHRLAFFVSLSLAAAEGRAQGGLMNLVALLRRSFVKPVVHPFCLPQQPRPLAPSFTLPMAAPRRSPTG